MDARCKCSEATDATATIRCVGQVSTLSRQNQCDLTPPGQHTPSRQCHWIFFPLSFLSQFPIALIKWFFFSSTSVQNLWCISQLSQKKRNYIHQACFFWKKLTNTETKWSLLKKLHILYEKIDVESCLPISLETLNGVVQNLIDVTDILRNLNSKTTWNRHLTTA